jgi:hypothetical protein
MDTLHDHHWRPTPPEAVEPEASRGRFVGAEPLADNDPTKTMSLAAKAGSGLGLVAGLVGLIALAAAIVLLFAR